MNLEELKNKQFEFTGFQLLNLVQNFAQTVITEFAERELSGLEVSHLSNECIDYLSSEDLINIILMMRDDMTPDDLNRLLEE